MNLIWDFLATHRYLLWITLGLGVIGLLQGTVFYRSTLRLALSYQMWGRRLINAIPDDRFASSTKKMLRWYRKTYRSRWIRVIGLFQIAIVIGAATAGLLLLK